MEGEQSMARYDGNGPGTAYNLAQLVSLHLDELSAQGLRVWADQQDAWRWCWKGTELAARQGFNALGEAIIDALAARYPQVYNPGPMSEAPARSSRSERRQHFRLETPLAALTNGLTVRGDYDATGAPLSAFLTTAEGRMEAGAAGDLSGEWAGVALTIPPEALPVLRELFVGTTLPALQQIARLWAQDNLSAPPPPSCRPVHLSITMGIAVHLRDNRRSYRLTKRTINAMTDFIHELLDRELNVVDFTALPVLERVTTRRQAGMPPLPPHQGRSED